MLFQKCMLLMSMGVRFSYNAYTMAETKLCTRLCAGCSVKRRRRWKQVMCRRIKEKTGKFKTVFSGFNAEIRQNSITFFTTAPLGGILKQMIIPTAVPDGHRRIFALLQSGIPQR